MDYLEDPISDISKSLKLLKIHKKTYLGGVNDSIFLDHFTSLEHGLKFLRMFQLYSRNTNLIQRIEYLVSYVKQKLYSLTYLGEDESLVMNFDHVYSDLREEMKNVIINPGTNEYDMIFFEIFTRGYVFSNTSSFLCEKIMELVTSNCKEDLIAPMRKQLEDIRKMLRTLLEPFFIYATDVGRQLTVKEEEKEIFATITVVLDRASCFIYLSFVGKIDYEMVLSMKNSLSNLIIEEAQIMKMYLILDTYSIGNLISHIYMSQRLLEWNKKCYLGIVMGATLEDHFMSIKHGLQFLVRILQISRKYQEISDFKLHILHLVAIMKQKLYSLAHNQEDGNLLVNLEHAYGELREEMKNVVMKPGSSDHESLFPEILKEGYSLTLSNDFLIEKITKLVFTSCKADQIAPMMKELEELREKLILLRPWFDFQKIAPNPFPMKLEEEEEEENLLAALTTFLDRATCLVYLSFVEKLNEDRLVSMRKNFSLLIEEAEMKEISLVLGSSFEGGLESDIDISLSLLQRQEEYHIGTINEAMLKEHIMSLKHGIDFLKWLPKIYIDRDLKGHIILLTRILKQKLESLTYNLTYKQWDASLMNMDVNGAYADLREEMKNVIINPATDKYRGDNDFLKLSSRLYHYRGKNDYLLEKITTLVTSNCKADQIAPLKKELQDLQKLLTFLKPLVLYISQEKLWSSVADNIFTTLVTFQHKATILIYLSFVGKMDIEMVISVKSDISTTIKETNVWEMYTMILNKVHLNRVYHEKELYLLENLMLLLQSNVESLNDASSKLYEVLMHIHSFLLGMYPNVLLRKRHLLQPTFQAILGHSIPIVCSCYLEHTEVDLLTELDCVLDLIKHIKSEAQEIKLYYFPRTDDLGFLEFFLGYLEDLLNNPEIPMEEEIGALHFEVHSLLSLVKVTNEEEFNETPWTDIINMAYQAEYIIDLKLGNSRDLGFISSLSMVIEQFKNIRIDVQGLCCRSVPAEDGVATFKTQVLGTTTQVDDNDAIVGFQKEAKTITEYLLKGEDKLDVISIIGMAGVGKTTLALTLYKAPSMADIFDIRAWCTVSQSHHNRAVLLAILHQVNPHEKNLKSKSDDQELADHLCRSLKKRRYLIVLDDIWDTTLWYYLKRYLPDDRKGSRVLITTRNKDVANQIGSKMHELRGLTEENSWLLFQKKVFKKESLPDYLVKISKGIVEKCKGLPLSIVVIAGILSAIERTEKNWNQLAESVSSLVFSDSQVNCKAILELSYNHLPNHLKSCFLYLGLFPEDQEITVNHLINLWIAEGLVRGTTSDGAEEVAKKHVDELIVKSLVIPVKERSRGGVKTLRLHDLLREFCLDKAKETHFFTLLDEKNCSRPLQDPRRLILIAPHVSDLHISYHSVRSMICFHALNVSEIEKGIESCDMVLLKVLVVVGVWSNLFPNISSLVHLRYLALGLDYLEISVLPSSISKLQNLQILILRCRIISGIEVPDSIWDMVKLRHVHISPKASFQVDINRFRNSSPFLLENLRSLSRVQVSRGDSKWLSKLSGLQRLCCIFVDDDLVDDDVQDNQFRILCFNDHLTSLKVENATSLNPRFVSTCHLPISLQELTLSEFFITSNDISDIGRALPHLEVFKMYNCYVPSGYEWNVDNDDFPELKVLKLWNLEISNWRASENSFPSLEQLWVEECDYLDEIPLDFGYLLKLRLIYVRGSSPSVDNSAREIEKIQHEEQNTKMKVHIYPKK